MAPFDERMQHLDRESVHVGEWQHAHYAVAGLKEVEVIYGVLYVAP